MSETNTTKTLNNAIIIGIDLGTTNSEVALIHDGKAKVLAVDGAKIVPSVVSLNANGEILIGNAAVNNELVAPADTIRRIKRKMGQQEFAMLGNKSFTPPMVSSLILKRLKLAAEGHLNHPVSKAVITVPAFFNESQREATKEAAELAGLEVVRLLNEPTAAALAYSLGKQNDECCLVYDLGGGTFDVSIVQLSPGVMEVKASHGDVELGGADFDRLIADKARQAFLAKHEIDLAKDPLAWARLMRAAEQAKIKLSTEASAQITEEFIAHENGTPLHLQFAMTRTEFEALIRPFLERTLTSVRKALEMAEINANQLQRVILVGGATYTPLVSQMLETELKITPQAWIDPSLVVAMGAAIEAANFAGQSVGPMMIDVTPHSLGTGCYDIDGYLFNCIIIRRNSPLPCTASKVFYKMFDEQKAIEVSVYQGESSHINHNKCLGKFLLEGLEDSSGRDVCIKYHLDRSGLLHVTATDISSGKKASQTLKKIANSRVSHANLADLASVKIDVEAPHGSNNHLSEEDELFWEAVKSDGQSITTPQEEVIGLSVENLALIEKAQKLIDAGSLSQSDLQELSNELHLSRIGDKEAQARLSNLIYYLE